MKCARREAGAQRPVASTPPRSPSSRQAPPEDRYRPDPLGGRARRSLLLAVLALLLGALGLFAAAPAQAQTTVWSATLTADRGANNVDLYGCDSSPTGDVNGCTSLLTEDEFTYGGTTYTIRWIRWLLNTNTLDVSFGITSNTAKTALGSLTLNVDGTAFAISSASTDATTQNVEWPYDPATDWQDGTTVSLSLTAPPKPAKPTGFSATAGYRQVTLRWDNPNDPTITKYQVFAVAPGAVGTTTDIPGAGTTRHVVKGLVNGDEYKFAIRAVNGAGDGPWSINLKATPSGSGAVNVHGLELSQFKVEADSQNRLTASWRVRNPDHRRCAYRVAWRKAGTMGDWQYKDVYSYASNPSFRTWYLRDGSYDVRMYVHPPRSGPDWVHSSADLAFEATAGTLGAPPPIPAAGPALSSARVNGASMMLGFDALLDDTSVPAGSAFAVSVAGSARTVSNVTVSGERVLLTLAQAVSSGEAVTVGYTPPATGRLRAPGGGAEVAAFSGQAVANDTPVSSLLQQAPPPSPLTARVAGAPAEHKGKGAFALRIAFSEAVKGNTKAAARTIQVTGGTLKRVRRAGKNKDLWELRIAPSGHGDVTLTLPATADCEAAGAVCTADGRKLESALVHTVPGPVTLSVADARAREGEDATIDFAVTLSRAASGPVTVNYRTRNGTAKAGRDYTKASGTLTFAASETSRTVSVPVLDDARDEGEETFRLLLGKPKGAVIADGEAVGTIANDDPMPAAWLARFGRTVAGQGDDAVRERMAADRTPGFRGRIAGEALPDGTGADAMVAERGRDEDEDPLALPELSGSERRAFLALLAPEAAEGMDGDGALPDRHALAAKDAMLDTAFEIARETDGGLSLGLWGRVARSGFSGRAGDMALDGEVTTAMIGTDWKRRDTVLGLMLLRSRGEGGHSGPAGAGRMEAELSGVVPWAGLRAGTLSLWGAAGTGRGEMTLATPEGKDSVTAGLDWSMAAAGAEGALAALGGADLRWRADALAARTDSEAVRSEAGSLAATSSETARLRLGLEAAWARTLASGATLSPRLEIGLRHDGGDAGSGLGLEAGGGVRFTDPGGGLSVSLDGRALALHEDRDLRDWGLAVSVAWDPRPETRLGPSVIASRGWGGAPSGGVAALLEAEALPGGGTDAGSGGLGLEMAWGADLSAWRHGMVGSAYGRVPDAESLRLGWRVAPDTGLPAGRDHDFWLEPGGEDGAGIGAGLRWSAERRHVRSSAGIDIGARDGGGVEAGFRLTREW